MANCVISAVNIVRTLAIADTKLYIPVITLSINDNAKLLQQLKCGFNCTINFIKYQSKATIHTQNQYLDDLIDPSFQVVNRIFVLSFEINGDRIECTGYLLPKVQIKDNNFMIDGKNFFDQSVRTDLRTYNNIRKIATGQKSAY